MDEESLISSSLYKFLSLAHYILCYLFVQTNPTLNLIQSQKLTKLSYNLFYMSSSILPVQGNFIFLLYFKNL